MGIKNVGVLKGDDDEPEETYEHAKARITGMIDRSKSRLDKVVELSEQVKAQVAYPNHSPEAALANYKAGREVYDTNGDLW